MSRPRAASPAPSPLRRAVVGSAANGALLGAGIAALTVDLDPHLAAGARVSDAPALLAWGAVFYALLALIPGLAAGVLLETIYRATGGRARSAMTILAAAVATVPLLYLLLLPDAGLTGRFLTDTLFAGSFGRRLAYVGAFGLLCLAAGTILHLSLRRRAGRRAVAGLWSAALLAVVVAAVFHPGPEETRTIPRGEIPSPAGPAPPVLLLCVDGAEPAVIRELVAAGELPTFARLMREGTRGPLETLEPTLSPVIWTTLATGRRPEDHGIRQFVHVRLPGVSAPIYEFPLHTGLNFELLPRVEDLLGVRLRVPYTTGMRRVEALWNMVDRADAGRTDAADVGVYRWLMAWPAEEVEGFFVAGAIAWAEIQTEEGKVHPPDLYRGLEQGRLPPPSREELLRLLRGSNPSSPASAPSHHAGSRLPGERLLAGSYRDPTVRDLPALLRRHRPAFAAASFYPVDAAQHLFGRFRGGEGLRSKVVDAHYRLTDGRLGRLLGRLEEFAPDTRLVVVSDHGFDFRANHHANAPPGVFFGHGPGFAPGREVRGLSVYDVTPLVLRLLRLPVAENMPGARTGRYRRALDPTWRATHPEHRIATWETGDRGASDEVLRNEEVEEVLRSLGYVGE